MKKKIDWFDVAIWGLRIFSALLLLSLLLLFGEIVYYYYFYDLLP